MTAALHCSALTRRFGRTLAVDRLDLTVPTGSIFALLGPNGAGKSTTLKLALNLLTPTAGRVELLGRDARRLTAAAFTEIGYVAEGQDLPSGMTVDAFLRYCRALYPRWDHNLEKRLRTLFELPGDRRLKHLSRGMRMKAALLSTLAFRPALLLLDEPFSGLDPLVRDDLVQGLLELPTDDRPATIVVSTHDLDDVQRLVDHAAFLAHGRLLLSEPTDPLLRRHRAVELTWSQPPAAPIAPPEPGWRRVETDGAHFLRFVDSVWDADASEARLRQRFPDAQLTHHALSLRELYLVIARSSAHLLAAA